MTRKIVDPVKYDQEVNVQNKEWLSEFLITKNAEGKTEKTLIQYKGDLRIIFYMLYEHFGNKEITKLTKKDITRFLVMLKNRGLSSARINRLKSSLSSILEHLSEDDEVDYSYNIASKIKGMKKDPVREITFLTEEQIQWLKNALIEQGETLQAVYLMLSYVSAARRGEVHQVLKEGLDKKFVTNTVNGKCHKKFKLYYTEEVQDLIKEYLQVRGKDLIPQLFVNLYRNGERRLVHPATFNAWCDKFSVMLSDHEGRIIHINPHSFRHSRLENLYRTGGVPIEKLKSLANHNDISTTESYLAERQEDDIAEIFGVDPSVFVS